MLTSLNGGSVKQINNVVYFLLSLDYFSSVLCSFAQKDICPSVQELFIGFRSNNKNLFETLGLTGSCIERSSMANLSPTGS